MTQERREQDAKKRGRWARFKAYLRDSRLELQKVIWPTKEEVAKMTGLVVAVVIVVSIYIVICDQVVMQATRPLFER